MGRQSPSTACFYDNRKPLGPFIDKKIRVSGPLSPTWAWQVLAPSKVSIYDTYYTCKLPSNLQLQSRPEYGPLSTNTVTTSLFVLPAISTSGISSLPSHARPCKHSWNSIRLWGPVLSYPKRSQKLAKARHLIFHPPWKK